MRLALSADTFSFWSFFSKCNVTLPELKIAEANVLEMGRGSSTGTGAWTKILFGQASSSHCAKSRSCCLRAHRTAVQRERTLSKLRCTWHCGGACWARAAQEVANRQKSLIVWCSLSLALRRDLVGICLLWYSPGYFTSHRKLYQRI